MTQFLKVQASASLLSYVRNGTGRGCSVIGMNTAVVVYVYLVMLDELGELSEADVLFVHVATIPVLKLHAKVILRTHFS